MEPLSAGSSCNALIGINPGARCRSAARATGSRQPRGTVPLRAGLPAYVERPEPAIENLNQNSALWIALQIRTEGLSLLCPQSGHAPYRPGTSKSRNPPPRVHAICERTPTVAAVNGGRAHGIGEMARSLSGGIRCGRRNVTAPRRHDRPDSGAWSGVQMSGPDQRTPQRPSPTPNRRPRSVINTATREQTAKAANQRVIGWIDPSKCWPTKVPRIAPTPVM